MRREARSAAWLSLLLLAECHAPPRGLAPPGEAQRGPPPVSRTRSITNTVA